MERTGDVGKLPKAKSEACLCVDESWGPGDLTPGWTLLRGGGFIPVTLGVWRCSFLSESSVVF